MLRPHYLAPLLAFMGCGPSPGSSAASTEVESGSGDSEDAGSETGGPNPVDGFCDEELSLDSDTRSHFKSPTVSFSDIGGQRLSFLCTVESIDDSIGATQFECFRENESEAWSWDPGGLPGGVADRVFGLDQEIEATVYFYGVENRVWQEFALHDASSGVLLAASVFVDGRWLESVFDDGPPGAFGDLITFEGSQVCEVEPRVLNSLYIAIKADSGSILPRSVTKRAVDDPSGFLWAQSWYHDEWLSFQADFVAE